jgi:hypothetical protein
MSLINEKYVEEPNSRLSETEIGTQRKGFLKETWCTLFHRRHHFSASGCATYYICQKCDGELIRLLIKAAG